MSHEDKIKSSSNAGEILLDLDPGLINDAASLSSLLHEVMSLNVQSVVIESITEPHAQELLAILKRPEYHFFTVPIQLPKDYSQLQIEFDNLISNHQLSNNINRLKSTVTKEDGDSIKIPRILPERIEPKVEIILFEEEKTETEEEVQASDILLPQHTRNILSKLPIAEEILSKIFQNPAYTTYQAQWKSIVSREEALEARKNISQFLQVKQLEKHPLLYLVEEHAALREQLKHWTKKLKLEIPQYDALLDVYGQYGEAGLRHLFQEWERSGPSFIELHETFLNKMPSYIPFIADPVFQKTMENIRLQSPERYSWFLALLKKSCSTN